MKNKALTDRYSGFFSHSGITVLSFDPPAALLYSQVRQDRTIKRADAIQLAVAAAAGIDLFITNDTRLSRVVAPGIDFISSLDRAPL